MTTPTRNARRNARRSPVATAATTPTTTPATDAAPVPARNAYGLARSADTNAVRALVAPFVARFPLFAAYSPADDSALATLTTRATLGNPAFYGVRYGAAASDIPALLDTAAALLAAVGADAGPVADVPAASLLDVPASLYYGLRRRHPALQTCSDVDRRDAASRLAAALLASCDALANRTASRTVSGRYGTRDVAAHVMHGIAAHVRTLRAALVANV